MRKTAAVMLLIIVMILGCAAQKPLTREESLKLREELIIATSRVYEKTSKEDVLKASEKLFQLADNDFKFVHAPNAVIADRKWSYYLVLSYVLGWDRWFVVAEEKNNRTEVAIRIFRSVVVFPGVYTERPVLSSGELAIKNLPGVENTLPVVPLYNLFYKRLDYLLGKGGEWTDCEKAKNRLEEKKISYEELDPLCDSMTVDDKKPQEVSNVRF